MKSLSAAAAKNRHAAIDGVALADAAEVHAHALAGDERRSRARSSTSTAW